MATMPESHPIAALLTEPVHDMTAIAEALHDMAANAELLHDRASIAWPRQGTALTPELRQTMAPTAESDLPEPCYVSSGFREPRQDRLALAVLRAALSPDLKASSLVFSSTRTSA
ncbi:hypothetical protein M9458_021057, partial [Cirrhinus mrigala]